MDAHTGLCIGQSSAWHSSLQYNASSHSSHTFNGCDLESSRPQTMHTRTRRTSAEVRRGGCFDGGRIWQLGHITSGVGGAAELGGAATELG